MRVGLKRGGDFDVELPWFSIAVGVEVEVECPGILVVREWRMSVGVDVDMLTIKY
jgi:hypothetical protein